MYVHVLFDVNKTECHCAYASINTVNISASCIMK